MRIPVTTACLACTLSIYAQVHIEHTIPAVLSTGQELVVEVTIVKPVAREFAQYELETRPGIAFREVASAGGTFSSDKGRLKITWPLADGSSSLRVRFSMLSTAEGEYALKQTFSYEFSGARRIAQFQDIGLRVQSGAEQEIVSQPVRINQVVPQSLPMSRIDSLENRMMEPGKAATHAAQLRRDAREARRVGEAEVKEADLELKEAKLALIQARQNPDAAVKEQLVKEAEDRLQKAETNRQVAMKIIALSASLEKNADDIEKAVAARKSGDSLGRISAQQQASKSAEDMAKLKQAFAPKPGDQPAPAGTDTLFHIQLGAFGQQPELARYRKAGQVNVITENGLYKVLVGGFRSRDEAQRRRQELTSAGYEGFIVRYAGNRRVY